MMQNKSNKLGSYQIAIKQIKLLNSSLRTTEETGRHFLHTNATKVNQLSLLIGDNGQKKSSHLTTCQSSKCDRDLVGAVVGRAAMRIILVMAAARELSLKA